MSHIRSAFSDFVEFLSSSKKLDIKTYRDELYKRIDLIMDMIEEEPDRDKWETEFYSLFDQFDISPIHHRARVKPLGYAGDFLLIDWIYTNKTAPSGLGKRLDMVFQSYEAAEAVRNRKKFFIKKCLELIKLKKGRVNVLNLGCGPCRDVLETYQASKNGKNLYFHCVDQEPKAIAYAKNLLSHEPMQNNITLDCTNMFHLNTVLKYDLIWIAGLFDYLEDRVANLLLKKIWRYLKEDGQIIFGNFSPKNPTRKGMEAGCRWYLIHRSAQELAKLCTDSKIPFREIDIESEPLGINLFCSIKK
jgi:extracellular factor (EF) 3-hydroxypalmitic acid methyl ester biosynthesis protein